MTKQPTRKPAAKTADAAPRAARKQQLEADRAKSSKARPDPQSGMDPTGNEDAERRIAEQFRAADAVGQPRTDEEQAAVDEATLNRQIRGY